MDESISVIALSQLNRESTDRPNMAQLRDSGQIEQDADMIILMRALQRGDDMPVSRAEFERIAARGGRIIECSLCKARDGVPGRSLLEFHPDTMSYAELAPANGEVAA